MNKHFNLKNVKNASLALYFLTVVSIFYSYFLVSVALIGLCLLAVIFYFSKLSWQAIKWKPLAMMTLGILPFIFGIAYSDHTFEAVRELQHNAAYLFVPLAILFLPPIEVKGLRLIISFFIIIVAISTFPVIWQYVRNFDEITLSLGSGKAIPTPIDHVRYSILVCFGLVFSFIGLIKNETFFNINGRKIFLFISVYLFCFIHLLAVRSGIILTYIGLLTGGSLLLIQSKKYLFLILLWLIIIISPIIAYYSIPSFKNKISYTMYDFSLLKQGKGSNYSDSERLRSLQIGIEIWKSNPILGVGTGDLKSEIEKIYIQNFGIKGQPKYPHNQLIKYAAASGIIGVLLFVFSLYFPFFYEKNYLNPYVLTLITILSISFLVEATLERSYMLVFYVVFGSLLYRNNKKPNNLT